jgi:hypothetical protein
MAQFVHAFDCKDETHVLWLKEVGHATAKTIVDGARIDITSIVNMNPLPGQPKMKTPTDWAFVHFQLAMKYSNAVLDGEAFIPVKLV